MQCQAVVTGVKSETVLSDHIANRRFCGYASTPSGEFMEFRLLNQNLFRLVRALAPLFHWRWAGEATFVQQLDAQTKLKMRTNLYDRWAVYEVWGRLEYKDKQFVIAPGDVVVDIGAHIGAFSVWAACQAPLGRVYAFEPNGENHALLVENKNINNLNNLEAFNIAVSDRDGEASFFNSDHSSMSHSFFESGEENTIKVRTISLAGILAENQIDRVNYLKIDAEGAEYLIILNAPADVLDKVDRIFLEFHDYLDHGHHYQDLERHLTAHGFQVMTGRNFISRLLFKIGYIKAVRNKSV